MRKLSVNIGEKFHRLTINRMTKNRHNQTKLECICDCGKIVFCMPHSLSSGHTKSCGCLKIEKSRSRRKYKLGARFGKLVLIKETSKRNKHNIILWEFKCDCGKIIERPIKSNAKSCGCLKKTCKDPIKSYYNHNISNCTRKGRVEFQLTLEQFKTLIEGDCFYCGAKPSMKVRYYDKLRNGIDRKNNKKGYLIENCVSCCQDCNYAKRMLSFDEFISLIKRIYDKQFSK